MQVSTKALSDSWKGSLFATVIMLVSFSGLYRSFQTIRSHTIPYSPIKACYKLVEQHNSGFTFALKNVGPKLPVVTAAAKSSHPDRDPEAVIAIGSDSIAYNGNPYFLIWAVMFSMMVGTSWGLLIMIVGKLISVGRIGRRYPLIQSVLILLVCGAALYFAANSITAKELKIMNAMDIIDICCVLLTNTQDVRNLVNVTSGIGALAASGMVLINFCVPRLLDFEQDEFIEVYQQLTRGLDFFLKICATLVVFSIVTTSLLQKTLENAVSIEGIEVFPSEFIYLYSLSFTIILALVYLPIEYNLSKQAQKISALKKDNKELNKFHLKSIEQSPKGFQKLQIVLSILSPLLGTLAVDLIGHLLKP